MRFRGGGIDSFLGFEYGDVITLASRVFRVLLPILPASLRFLRSALGLRWPSCLAPRPRCGCHLIGAHLRWGNRFLSWIRVRQGDYSRVKSVSSTSSDSSNEPVVFAHFWLRRGHMVLRPRLSCLTSRFTHVLSFYWVFRLLWRSSGLQLRWRRSPRRLQRRFFC